MLNSSISFVNDKNINNKDSKYIYKSKDEIYKNLKLTKLIFVGDSISSGEKILYKNIEIGFVKEVYLENDIKKATAYIHKKYENLINNSTQFYKLKDMNFDISTKGIKVNIGSFKQIYNGGISFVTQNKLGKLDRKSFNIYKDLDYVKRANQKNNFFYATVHLKELYNLKDTSKLYYKNIEIGEVESIKLKEDIQVRLKVHNRYKDLFHKNSIIYLEGMVVSLQKVKNISSSIFGDKLHLVAMGHSKIFKNEFDIDSINPIDTKYKDGLRVVLVHTNSKDISIDAPVYYNYFKIGNIESIDLNTVTNKIEITLFIEKVYQKYIQRDTIFKKTSVIDIDLGLMSSKIKIGTLESLSKGGIDVISSNELSRPVPNGTVFSLSIDEN